MVTDPLLPTTWTFVIKVSRETKNADPRPLLVSTRTTAGIAALIMSSSKEEVEAEEVEAAEEELSEEEPSEEELDEEELAGEEPDEEETEGEETEDVPVTEEGSEL